MPRSFQPAFLRLFFRYLKRTTPNKSPSSASNRAHVNLHTNTAKISMINNNCKAIQCPADLSYEYGWSCAHIRDVPKHLFPSVTHGTKIPIGFVRFFPTGFHK